MSDFPERDCVLRTAANALTGPEAFFSRRDPSLRSGLAVVLATTTLNLLVVVPLLWVFRHVIPVGELGSVAVVVGLMYGYALLRWVVLAGVVYGAVWPMDADGDFRRLLAYLGWSHLPNLVGAVVMLAVTTVAVLGVTPPTTEPAAGRAAADVVRSPFFRLSSAYGTVEAQTGVSLGQLQYVLGLAQLTWSAVMWFAAAKVGCRLTDRQALLAVALPILVAGLVAGLPGADVGVSI